MKGGELYIIWGDKIYLYKKPFWRRKEQEIVSAFKDLFIPLLVIPNTLAILLSAKCSTLGSDFVWGGGELTSILQHFDLQLQCWTDSQ